MTEAISFDSNSSSVFLDVPCGGSILQGKSLGHGDFENFGEANFSKSRNHSVLTVPYYFCQGDVLIPGLYGRSSFRPYSVVM